MVDENFGSFLEKMGPVCVYQIFARNTFGKLYLWVKKLAAHFNHLLQALFASLQ
jgi:hypothetical protein